MRQTRGKAVGDEPLLQAQSEVKADLVGKWGHYKTKDDLDIDLYGMFWDLLPKNIFHQPPEDSEEFISYAYLFDCEAYKAAMRETYDGMESGIEEAKGCFARLEQAEKERELMSKKAAEQEERWKEAKRQRHAETIGPLLLEDARQEMKLH